jgi:Mrp family chromosome partitioning ATPase
MRNLIKELKSRYTDRYIIIDSPPFMSTSEPDVLAEQVDGVVLVVRAGMTPRELVEDVLAQLNHDKVLGVVMNDVKTGISKYYAPSYSA